MSTTPQLIGSTEASRLLACSPRTVHRLVAAGKLTPVVHAPGSRNGVFLFDRADVLAYRDQIKDAAS